MATAMTNETERSGKHIPTRTLDALNFFLADVRDGLGPYLAIYLIAVRGPAHGWNEATVGVVLTIAGIVGLLSQTPAGVLIDRARNKPRIIAAAALLVTLSSVSLPLVSGYTMVAITQSIAAAAGAVFAPAISAVTLGLVGPRLFARRVGRNEAFNHAGNAVSAGLAGLLAWKFGPVMVFWLMGGLTVASIGAAMRIRNGDIDNAVARGLDREPDEGREQPGAWRCLIENRPLLLFAGIAFTFHLANAAMLTSVGQLLAKTVGKDQATSLTAACIVAAQLVMVPVAIVVGRNAERWGTKPIFLVAFGFLAARGALYTVSDDPSARARSRRHRGSARRCRRRWPAPSSSAPATAPPSSPLPPSPQPASSCIWSPCRRPSADGGRGAGHGARVTRSTSQSRVAVEMTQCTKPLRGSGVGGEVARLR